LTAPPCDVYDEDMFTWTLLVCDAVSKSLVSKMTWSIFCSPPTYISVQNLLCIFCPWMSMLWKSVLLTCPCSVVFSFSAILKMCTVNWKFVPLIWMCEICCYWTFYAYWSLYCWLNVCTENLHVVFKLLLLKICSVIGMSMFRLQL
jgi:hypothetical protein